MLSVLANILLIISYLLIAAHFLRYGKIVIALLIAITPILLLFKRSYIKLILSAGLIIATAEWTRTYLFLKQFYSVHGIPFSRAGFILKSVIAFNIFTIAFNILLFFKKAKEEKI